MSIEPDPPRTDDDSPMCCMPSRGWLEQGPLPAVNDAEGERLPDGLPPVVDAHVHLFPDRVFEAIWRWFDAHGWPVRYKLPTPRVIDFLLSRGVSHVVALHYAHKPGMARALNAYIAEIAAREPRVVGLATVLPGEPGAADVVREAFDAGLRGVKLHCHVQAFSIDSPELRPIFELAAERGLPCVVHAGREPVSPAYKSHPHSICSADRVERVLVEHPKLRLCVPHLGADEFAAYARLLEKYDNLWLDTTMVLAGYLPGLTPFEIVERRPDRVLYGTDFPNIPYAWDREVRALERRLRPGDLELVLGRTACELFSIP
jgi:predicted TIM-barrel fold metal-dependent hydrolase